MNPAYKLETKIGEVTDAYAQPSFWTGGPEAERVLLDGKEIAGYNRQIAQNAALNVLDLTEEAPALSTEQLLGLMAYSGFERFAYLDGKALDEAGRRELERLCHLDALRPGAEVRADYGLITNETAARAYPTDSVLMERPDDWDFDRFQETALKVGEGVRIYHRTADGEWCFVRAKNDHGWVRCRDIAPCGFEEMRAYLAREPFVVVTRPVDWNAEGASIHLAMGSRLLYEEKDGKRYGKRPITRNGRLAFAPVDLDQVETHVGYLPYTTAHVLEQAMKLLNTPYGWGSRDHLLDCSATMLSVYECFGFSLPRNTAELAQCTRGAADVSAMGAEEKRALLQTMRPGCMLLTKGHVMMYLGVKEGTVYALHAFTFYADEQGNKRRIMQCTITPLTLGRVSGGTFLDGVYRILEIA